MKTFKDDLEEREEAEVFRRDGGADGDTVLGQDQLPAIDAVGWGSGGGEVLVVRPFRCREPGREGPRAGSPTPHTFSSTPTPQSAPPRAVRAETRKMSPARLAGDHVRPSSVVAIARASDRCDVGMDNNTTNNINNTFM